LRQNLYSKSPSSGFESDKGGILKKSLTKESGKMQSH